MNLLHSFFFSVYPYICLAVFLMGSLARFSKCTGRGRSAPGCP